MTHIIDGGATTPRGPDSLRTRPRLLGRLAQGSPWVLLVKVLLLAGCNAVGLYGAFVAALAESWVIAAALVAGLVVIDWVYLGRRQLAAKYLLPGLAFLLVYQIFVMAYTGYIAFTNYGDGHNSTQGDAIEAILAQNEARVEGTAGMPLTVVDDHQRGLGFAVVDHGKVLVGWPDEPLAPVEGAVVDGTRVVELPDVTVLAVSELSRIQGEVFALRVPVSEDPNAGSLRTSDGMSAYTYRSNIRWDEAADTMTVLGSGKVYTASQEMGSYLADDGSRLTPGWRVWIGWDNFARALLDPRISEPFVSVLIWTLVFVSVSTLGVFSLGLALALLFNTRMRGQRLYRSLIILPNAFPMFLSAFVWYGMLNTDFGFVNQVLFSGAQIPWLTDPWLARLSVLMLNFWLGFPYMFLVTTGALQSIPEELAEAAVMDGAGPWRRLRAITLPLLLIAVSPVLISTFAFNFNNFNVIYLLTGGGPNDVTSTVSVGATDILISFVYKLAFGDSGRDYGLASAISLLIFVIVGVIAIVSFRRTRKLEEVYQ